jgi:hypothetical protein
MLQTLFSFAVVIDSVYAATKLQFPQVAYLAHSRGRARRSPGTDQSRFFTI